MSTTDTEFDWSTEDVAVPYQPAIAVRGDENGNVAIRQHGMQEDQFLDISRVHVVSVCRAILREAGFHHLTIAPLDYVHLRDREGNPATVMASQSLALAADFEKLDRIAEEERLDRLAGRTPWQRTAQPKPKDRTAAERQRRHRAANGKSHGVTDRDGHGEPGAASPAAGLRFQSYSARCPETE